MMTVENRVGRFCETRFVSPFALAEVDAFRAKVQRIVAASSTPLVFCCDMRRVQIFPPQVADELLALMQSENHAIERNGLLLGEGSTFGMQMERMIRDAKHPGRKTFHSKNVLLGWLGEVLSTTERPRLQAFLDDDAAK